MWFSLILILNFRFMKKLILTFVAVLTSLVLMAQHGGGEKIRQAQHQFITALETDNPHAALEVLKKNPRLKKLSYNGEPILHYLMLNDNSEDIINYLIQSGVDMHIKDSNGYNCVEFCLVNIYSKELNYHYFKNLASLVRNGYNLFEPILLNFSFDKTRKWSRYNSSSESYDYYDTIVSIPVEINWSLFYEIWDEHNIKNFCDDGLLKSHQEAILLNIQRNNYPDIPDNKGYTPLAYLLANELTDAAVYLINNGALAEIKVPKYMGIPSVSPIFCAIQTPNAQNLIEVLMKKGAKIHETFNDYTPIGLLYAMISNGILDSVKATQCLGNLLPIVKSNYSVFSPETYSVPHVFQIYRVNEFGETVSLDTTYYSKYTTNIYEFLGLKYIEGTHNYELDPDAISLLRTAVINNLTAHHSLYSAPDSEGKFPIHYLSGNETDSLIAHTLTPASTDIQQVDTNGFNPIHYAMINPNGLQMTEYLINHQADVNAKIPDIPYREELYNVYFEQDNQTHFHFRRNIWADFLRNGQNMYIKYHGCTPLHIACSRPNKLATVKLLIENGADINAIHQIIGTPLHVAISHRSEMELIQFLVENGANLNIKNHAGLTPAEFAKNLYFNEIYQYLSETERK